MTPCVGLQHKERGFKSFLIGQRSPALVHRKARLIGPRVVHASSVSGSHRPLMNFSYLQLAFFLHIIENIYTLNV